MDGGAKAVEFQRVPWAFPSYVVALFVATGLSIWAAVIARSRRSAPGSPAFAWLMLIVAHFCLTTALHALVPGTEARLLIAKVRYLAVASVGVLWLLFASGYARVAWMSERNVRIALWILPAISLAA